MPETGFYHSTRLPKDVGDFIDKVKTLPDLSDYEFEPVKVSEDTWRCRMSDDGAVTLPKELLKRLGWEAGDTLSIETTEVSDYDGERTGILLTKVSPNSDESEPEVAS